MQMHERQADIQVVMAVKRVSLSSMMSREDRWQYLVWSGTKLAFDQCGLRNQGTLRDHGSFWEASGSAGHAIHGDTVWIRFVLPGHWPTVVLPEQ